MIPHSKPFLEPTDVERFRACLESGMINEGLVTHELEQAFCYRFNGKAALACGSGSQGLVLALRAVGASGGDEVIVPTYVCAEVLACIEAVGATARIVDVADDWLLDYDAAELAIGPRTKAIVLPYVMGIWRDFRVLADAGIPLIEDCAQYFPPSGRGLQGALCVFSFEATKFITCGEGGMVVSLNTAYDSILRSLKRFGDSPYRLNLYPLSDLLSSLALSQLARLPEFLVRRRVVADLYFELLADVPGLELPHSLRERSVFFRFPIRLTGQLQGKLDAIIRGMSDRGVVARRPVDLPLHRMRKPASPCSNADRLWEGTLSIPMYPALSDSQARTVAGALRAAVSAATRG